MLIGDVVQLKKGQDSNWRGGSWEAFCSEKMRRIKALKILSEDDRNEIQTENGRKRYRVKFKKGHSNV